jgi:hypothetical protein
MREDMKGQFGEVKASLKGGNMMSTFKPDDKENFIL